MVEWWDIASRKSVPLVNRSYQKVLNHSAKIRFAFSACSVANHGYLQIKTYFNLQKLCNLNTVLPYGYKYNPISYLLAHILPNSVFFGRWKDSGLCVNSASNFLYEHVKICVFCLERQAQSDDLCDIGRNYVHQKNITHILLPRAITTVQTMYTACQPYRSCFV